MGKGSFVAAALAAALLLAGCGGSSRRAAVERYVKQVDAVERAFGGQVAQAQRSYAAFGRDHVFGTESFPKATRTFVRLRARIAALEPPPEAAQVQRGLLRLLGTEVALAREVTGLDAYLRAERAPLARLRGAELRLRAGLATARTAAAQRRVFDAFAGDAARAETGLRAVRSPAPLLPWHTAELARVERLRREAADLSSALRQRDVAALRSRLAALRADIAGRDAVAAERAAIRAYDARAAEVSALASRVDAERARLEKRFG